MNHQAQIAVLGVHKFEFNQDGVEGHLATICPPYSEKRRGQVREMLDSTVLVELLVIDRDKRFNVSDLKQATVDRDWSWLYPVGMICAWYLTADGAERFDFDDDEDYDGSAPPIDIKTFRVAIYFRGWDVTKPLQSSYGELQCNGINGVPERYAVLSALAPYLSGD